MSLQQIQELAVGTLDDSKGRDIQVIDIQGVSSFADAMIVCTGTSTTHVRAMGGHLEKAFKEAGEPPMGVEGGPQADWVLVDLGNVIVHIMTESARAHYALEKLWDIKPKAGQTEAAAE
nr:ribosome silencing factor [Thiosulfatimonas sediminis]